MRLISNVRRPVAPLLAGTALLALGASSPTFGQTPAPADGPPNPEDLLGNLVVVAGGGRSLPKIGVLPSLASAMEDVTIRSVMRRDLDLCGEFELLPDSAAPDGLYLADSPIDVKAWSAKGVEAVVKVSGKRGANNQAEVRAQAYFTSRGQTPVYDKRFLVPESDLRVEAHHLADLVIGALTGLNGSFASHMAFSSASGGPVRRVFTIDADGDDARAVSPETLSAIAPAFGRNEELFYAAGPPDDLYKVSSASGMLMPLPVKGSVYGIAFSRDRSAVAVSIGVGATVNVFSGPDFMHVTQASPIGMALHPTFTPGGKLAFVGEGRWGERVFVDGKPISPDGLFASSPTFCNNPNGVRAVFAVGVGKNTDLVSTGESGGGLARLTQGQGRNGYPACSPDGRLVAFFSTRTSSEGPGLYVMRLDGMRPKRISTLLGDSLRWDPLPPSKAVELKN
jgi:TolB protein